VNALYGVLIENRHCLVQLMCQSFKESERLMFKNGMRPVHPGAILMEDYIKPLGISVRALSLALHMPYSHLNEIITGQRSVTVDIALRLERYFGNEAQGWLNLQNAYDLRLAEASTAGAKPK
jgi:addiction module HigA family antidote